MQDNWQEFDRHFKSVLQDGEEKAPRRVWRAVSERLDQAAAPVAWWRWAVPALAFAAIALGLVLTGTFDRRTADPAHQIIAQSVSDLPADMADPSESSADTGESPEGVMGVSAEQPSTGVGAARKLLAVNTADAASQTAAVVPDDSAGSVQDAEEVPVSDIVSDGGFAAGQEAETVNKDDSFAEDIASQWASLGSEDMAGVSHSAFDGLYARGTLGGNDSNISYGGAGISRMAPGPGSADAGISESGASTYGVPFTLGVGARVRLSDRLSLGSGLDYSLLSRTFAGTYSDSYTGNIHHVVHYLGVPLNVYYDLINNRDGLFNIYGWGGGTADFCVSNSYRLMSAPGTVIKDKAGSFQFSVALGVGMEFKLNDFMSVYLDPAVRYYLPGDGTQPKTVRTDKPFMFNFDAGLRFNL